MILHLVSLSIQIVCIYGGKEYIYNIKIHKIFYMVMVFNSISEKSILRISDINVPHLEAVECVILLIIIIKFFNTKLNVK